MRKIICFFRDAFSKKAEYDEIIESLNTVIQNNIDTSKRVFDDMAEENKVLSEKNTQLYSTISKLNIEIDKLTNEMCTVTSDFADKMRSKDSTIKTLETMNARLENRGNALSKCVDNNNEKVLNLEATNLKIESELFNAKNEMMDAKDSAKANRKLYEKEVQKTVVLLEKNKQYVETILRMESVIDEYITKTENNASVDMKASVDTNTVDDVDDNVVDEEIGLGGFEDLSLDIDDSSDSQILAEPIHEDVSVLNLIV